MAPFPPIFRVRQRFDRPRVDNIAGEVRDELNRIRLADRLANCKTLAIAVGSRGIANLSEIVKATVDFARQQQVEPFIVPAMGSHGGATAEGQQRLIESYGVTEELCGCPIRSSMETAVVCHSSEGYPLHLDRNALSADAVLPITRVKPHTHLSGKVQSGLLKMLLIGLGNHEGAKVCHQAMEEVAFDTFAQNGAREMLGRTNVVAGLALVENAYNETAIIEAVPGGKFIQRDAAILETATEWMPRLPFLSADILLIDEIGKDISGVGMDTNIVGRKKIADDNSSKLSLPTIQRILVRGLSQGTQGNGMGIGLADFCLSRAVHAMDEKITQVNSLTARNPTAAIVPPDYPTDQEMLTAAWKTLDTTRPEDAKIIWIDNTLRLGEVECSLPYWEAAQQCDNLEILLPPRPLPFNTDGNLPKQGRMSVT